MPSLQNDSQAELLAELSAVEASLRASVREALLRHKQAGNPIAGWRNGKVEWLTADQIDLTAFEPLAAESSAVAEPVS
jgi:hypothetical protein